MTKSQVTATGAIVNRIRPILTGNKPEVIGAALADVVATWLAGHFDDRGPKETDELREAMITQWLATMRALIKPNEQMMLERLRRGSN
jgi:hypothetical protein